MASYKENLIIAADDFGISRSANENILSLVRQKKINRVAVLIDYSATAEEVSELISSEVKIDLHLRLKKFDGDMNYPLGVCRRVALFLWYYFSGSGSVAEIEKEWQRQIEKFLILFKKTPDGMNSHQYLHFFPPYFKIVLELGKKYQIPYLRFGKMGISENVNSISGILNWLWKINNSRFKKFSFDSSDFLASYDWISDFPIFLEKLPPGKTELVFHPERPEELEVMNKYF